jgi:hypothetical protein
LTEAEKFRAWFLTRCPEKPEGAAKRKTPRCSSTTAQFTRSELLPIINCARELRMSPANVYKFFPSKKAVLEAVGERHMTAWRQRLLPVTKSRKTAWERIEDLIRAVVEQVSNQEQEMDG